MPIEGITGLRRAPRLGKVRLGVKALSKAGNEYPKAVDYFVVHTDELATDEEMAAAFHKVYGPEPRELDIMFPSDDPEQFFPQFRKRYGSGRGLICKGDGVKAHEVNKDTGELVAIACLGEKCPHSLPNEKNQVGCKPMASLFFLLPNVPGVGCWQMDTNSFHTIVQINSALEMIARITEGKLGFIPLKLVRKAKEVSPDGKKKTVYVVDVSLRGVSLNKLFATRGADVVKVFLPPPDTADEPLDHESAEEAEIGAIVDTEARVLPPQLPPTTPAPTAPQAEAVEDPETAIARQLHERVVAGELNAAGARERVAEKRAARVAQEDGVELKPGPRMSREDAIEQYGVLKAYAEKLGVAKDVAEALVENWRKPPFTQVRLDGIRKALEQNAPPPVVKQGALTEDMYNQPEPEEEGQ